MRGHRSKVSFIEQEYSQRLFPFCSIRTPASPKMGEESSRDDEQIGEEREGKGNKEKEREGKTL